MIDQTMEIKSLKDELRIILQTEARVEYHPEFMEKCKIYIEYEMKNQDEYYLDLNLAILKLYQLFPSYSDPMIASCILLKALMKIPKNDFLLCKYLLTEDLILNENIETILKLNNYLGNADYVKFWELLNVKSTLIKGIHEFENTIRFFILGNIASTFKNVKRNYVLEQVNMKDNDPSFDRLIYNMGWKQEFDDIIMDSTRISLLKNKNIGEKFDIDTIKKLMPALKTV
ncbi:unnamed protein product [Gordionus sp. m RMFG-2023]|uniref:eukaryotic translation initiation factor 3 subunit K-like n=1 Tax=Gordionus sp. m RMFG-2023 TaxID=3053472 RepID=UPI0030E32361